MVASGKSGQQKWASKVVEKFNDECDRLLTDDRTLCSLDDHDVQVVELLLGQDGSGDTKGSPMKRQTKSITCP